MLKLGEKTISKLYYGDKAISKAYWGEKLVFNKITKPYYCEVEYLESTGTQYIDTGLTGNTNTKAELSVTISTQSTGNVGIFGSRGNSANSNLLAIGYGTSALAIDFNNSSYSIYRAAISYAPGTKYICYTSKEERFIKDENGLVLAQNTTLCNDTISTGKLLLFAETGVNLRLEGKIFYAKIWDDVLARDYIPVLDNNMRPCLYDKVTGKLFYNQGSGEFIAGPCVTDGPKYTALNWLQSDGSAYINTGYALKSENCRIETSLYRTSDKTSRYVFGARSSINGSTNYSPTFNLPGYYTARIDCGKINGSVSFKTGSWHDFIIDIQSNVLNIYNNGINVVANKTVTGTLVNGYSFYLFCHNNQGAAMNVAGNVASPYWRLYDDGVLVRDMIPVLDENGVPCMYDKVEKVFHYNANTVGEFLYG